MAATLYRIDGTQRTYSQPFPTGANAIYDDYGVSVFTGVAHIVQIPMRSTVSISQPSTVGVGHRAKVRITQIVIARIGGRSTVRLPEE